MRRFRGILIVMSVCGLLAAGVAAATALAASRPKPGQACVAKKHATYKKAGLTCVKGRLRKLGAPGAKHPTTTEAEITTTTPAPAPAIIAAPGRYTGVTSQGHPVGFDVEPDSKNLTTIDGGAIDQTCSPARTWTFDGFSTGGYDYPMQGTALWHLPTPAGSKGTTSAGIAWSTQIKMDAAWSDATHTTGNYSIHTTFTDGGVSYVCDTAVTFTASH